MRVFRSALHEVGKDFCPPPTIAPVDVGDDAVAIAQRALTAAIDAPMVELHAQTPLGCWTWHGCLARSSWRHDVLWLKSATLLATIDTRKVFAVSMIADRVSGGLRLFIDGGSTLALWTGDAELFDAWLAALTPGTVMAVNSIIH